MCQCGQLSPALSLSYMLESSGEPGLHPRDPDGTGKQEFRSSPPACHEEPESRAMGLALDQIQLSVPI